MAQIWSDNTLNRLAQIVEEEYSSQLDIILDRYTIPVIAGTYDYQLPDYIHSIRRVTWKGYEINPRSRMDQIRSDTTPFKTTESQPREYIISGIGYCTLRFLPAPNISLVSPGTDLWDPLNYMNACVIEFSRVPVMTDETMRLPEFLRRLIFRTSILSRALSQEGQGQDLKGATYFEGKAKLMLETLKTIKSNLWLYCIKNMSPSPSQIPTIHHPVLPPNFPARS